MVKSKISVLAVSASLVATLGLCACGGQSANNANNAAPANTEATTETTTTEATTDAASSTSTDSQDNPIISWEGALEDGTLVSYMESDDGKNAAIAITPAGSSEAKRWMGAETDTGDNKVTITDDTTKESITLTLTKASADGTAEIEVEGYGKATIVPFTVNDYVVLESLKSAFTE